MVMISEKTLGRPRRMLRTRGLSMQEAKLADHDRDALQTWWMKKYEAGLPDPVSEIFDQLGCPTQTRTVPGSGRNED